MTSNGPLPVFVQYFHRMGRAGGADQLGVSFAKFNINAQDITNFPGLADAEMVMLVYGEGEKDGK